MKKLLLALAFLFSLSVMSYAQTKTAAKKTGKQTTVRKANTGAKKEKAVADSAKKARPVVKKEQAVNDSARKARPAYASKAAGPAKKDGTPDRRFKANKDTTVVVHRKKDGTPDKRYKKNKKKS